MIQQDMFTELSQNSFERLDEIIEYSPYSIDVLIRRYIGHSNLIVADPVLQVEGDPWGYEVGSKKNKPPIATTEAQERQVFDFPTKALIIYTPSRRFLKSVNIHWDEKAGDNLPIVAFFKDTDNIQQEDIIMVDLHDIGSAGKDNQVGRKLKVVDIRSKGTMFSFIKVYHVAPFRDKI